VTEDTFDTVAGHFVDKPKQDAINAAIWGFLAGCLSGPADTHFKKADDCNGLDAWRRVMRVIDGGLPHKLEEIRDIVRDIHRKPIKDVEGVVEGVAQFEQTLKEFGEAGGDVPSDSQKKSDLLAILPLRLREELLWRSSKIDEPFEDFSEFVSNQAAAITNTRRRHGGLHIVEPSPGGQEEPTHPQAEEQHEGAESETVDAYDANGTFIGSFNRFNSKGGGKGGKGGGRGDRGGKGGGKGGAAGRQGDSNRRPRLCPNCNKEHPGECKLPRIDVRERKCFICNEKHLAKDCPNKDKQKNPIKAVEDRAAPGTFFGIQCAVTEDGYTPVRSRGRPMLRAATLGD